VFSEDDLLPLSALQHLVFCERQAALIHIERLWLDDAATVEGHHLHEITDSGKGESRGDLRIARSLALRSLEFGLAGVADVVEFHRLPGSAIAGARLPSQPGLWRPFPVEYKRGRPKLHRADEVQLCAQALCLDEMLGTDVTEGALFYGKTRRRLQVAIDKPLRNLTIRAAARFRELIEQRITPPARWEKKCEQCSLLGQCRPETIGRSTTRYLRGLFSLERPSGDGP
jgi:CRISPR-associated exonuclease Cas4